MHNMNIHPPVLDIRFNIFVWRTSIEGLLLLFCSGRFALRNRILGDGEAFLSSCEFFVCSSLCRVFYIFVFPGSCYF